MRMMTVSGAVALAELPLKGKRAGLSEGMPELRGKLMVRPAMKAASKTSDKKFDMLTL